MKRLFRQASFAIGTAQPIPTAYRSNFIHLYFDIGWFGILNGSILSFLTIYAARLGASGVQIGLINAVPAVVTLMFALPAGTWLKQRPIRVGVFWSTLAFRLFYLLLIPLPWIFNKPGEIWAIIAIILIMSIPGTAMAVGFQALFAEAVPINWRGHVSGIRNAVVAVTSTVTTIVCGVLLTYIRFPAGYQIVFALGFVGAIASALHVRAVKPLGVEASPVAQEPGVPELDPDLPKKSNGRLRPFFLDKLASTLRLDILRGPFAVTVLLLFLFHLGQYLAIPVLPLYQVNQLRFSDQVISIGSSIFNVFIFLGSIRLSAFVNRFGNQKIMGVGVILLSLYPGLMSITRGLGLFVVASMVGGFAWSLAGGVLYNYLLEKVPVYDRPAYLAWYTLGLNAAILLGSLVGPAVAGTIGLSTGLAIFAVFRLSAGLAILKWG